MTKKKIGLGVSVLIASSFYLANQWKPVKDLPKTDPIYVAAKSIAVGYQKSESGGSNRCNYSVIGNANDKYILTNGHCINGTGNTTQLNFLEASPVFCDKVLATSPFAAFDVTLFKCDGVEAEPLRLNPIQLNRGDDLTHIQINCDYYKDSQCKVAWVYDNTENCEILEPNFGPFGQSQRCSSLGGSSGSPMMGRYPNPETGKLEIVGLFNSDIRDLPNGHGSFSAMVKLTEVLRFLKSEGYDMMAIQDELVPVEPEIIDDPKKDPVNDSVPPEPEIVIEEKTDGNNKVFSIGALIASIIALIVAVLK